MGVIQWPSYIQEQKPVTTIYKNGKKNINNVRTRWTALETVVHSTLYVFIYKILIFPISHRENLLINLLK